MTKRFESDIAIVNGNQNTALYIYIVISIKMLIIYRPPPQYAIVVC